MGVKIPQTMSLIAAVEFSQKGIEARVLRVGGDVTCDTLFGRLSLGASHVWVGHSPDDLKVLQADDVGTYDLIAKALGGPPSTYIVLELNDGGDSERLAFDFSVDLAQSIPVVLKQADGELLLLPEGRYL